MSAIFPLSKRAKLQRRRLGARPMWSRSHACRPIPESREMRDLLPDRNKDADRLGSPQTTSARSAYFAVFIHAVQIDCTISTTFAAMHGGRNGGKRFARSAPPVGSKVDTLFRPGRQRAASLLRVMSMSFFRHQSSANVFAVRQTPQHSGA
jgi:hypothetical protein